METKSPEIRFGLYEVDLHAGELRKDGIRLKLTGQPFQVLAVLLERPGEVVTREELQKRLWPDTFVDFDHNLNSAINRIREVLHDSAETPQFVETLPRRGYRFIAPVEATPNGQPATESRSDAKLQRNKLVPVALAACLLLLTTAAWLAYKKWHTNTPAQPVQRALTRLTSDEGLQTGATWSPDGRFIAYSSNRGGKYDIWIQQVSGGDPIQITKGPGENWMPDWFPDGKYIAYRSEDREGGIYITPALGGAGLQRKITSFGYYPHWSPDSSRILFQPGFGLLGKNPYVVKLDGSPPREVLSDHAANLITMFAMWHPDGKRITAWILDETTVVGRSVSPIPSFSTEPVDGGPAIESRLPPELRKQLEAVAAEPGIREWRTDFRFAWAPSGKAIYFERTFRGARNVWRMSVDPVTLQPSSVERLTTSPGLDAELSVSPDGSRLAFTSERQLVRAWAFPFEANRGRITGPAQPITSAGVEAWSLNLSRDGKKLGFWGSHDGQIGTWAASVPNGPEEPLVPGDSYLRDIPIWSPDGKRAAYVRRQTSSETGQLVVWSTDHRSEEPVAGGNSLSGKVFDWSPDGKSVLTTRWDSPAGPPSIWQFFVNPSFSGQSSARQIISDPNYELYQPHFSPDGRWIAFEAVKGESHSTLYAIPAAGGPRIRITDGNQWDDKPRWSPDGEMIYYLSERRGFFNVWGVHFDPVKGRPQGEPYQITSFETPILMIPKHIPAVDISLTDDRLVIPLAQASGNIWILDNVDR